MKPCVKFFFISIAVLSFFACAALAQEGDRRVEMTGYSSYSFGQIIKGSDNQPDGSTNIDHVWSHEVYTGLGFNAVINERLSILACVEGKMWHPYANSVPREFKRRNYSLWLDQGCASYAFGEVEKPWLRMNMGYFKYKYNPEVRNLGEFMFRTFTYPGFVINYFDFPANRLLGYQARFDLLGGNLKADAILISESETYPFGDFSPALLGSYNLMGMVEIGAGVEAARLISVNSKKTTPYGASDPLNNNLMVDSVVKDVNGNATVYYDSSKHYTFKAIKLMARMTFDPKKIVEMPFFGPEDLKLYGEIDVIGLQDYSFYYDDISARTPRMVGFNFPAFKILDVLALELEYYKFPFNTHYERTELSACPVPNDLPPDWSAKKYRYNEWKWSVYAKKTVIPGFAVTGQVARDHMRTTFKDGLPNYSEATISPGQWYWIMKLSYSL